MPESDNFVPGAAEPRPKVELGWVIARFSSSEPQNRDVHERVRAGAKLAVDELSQRYPKYEFKSVVIERHVNESAQRSLVDLMDLGLIEREAHYWDFACVVTEKELKAYEKSFALGAPASALNICVVSLAKLAEDADHALVERRLKALFFHLFGHLNDLPHSDVPGDYMLPPEESADLDPMKHYSESSWKKLDIELGKEADLRVEEEAELRSRAGFYIETMLRNRSDIIHSVVKARPWYFVLRLSKLATTATSTLVILLLTAESWDLGTSQPPIGVAGASFIAVGLTTSYLLHRQGLLSRGRSSALTEQRAAMNISVAIIVWLAMFTTYACLFAISYAIASVAFSPSLLKEWVSHTSTFGYSEVLTMSGFVATLGVVLGALGASFEEAKYFRYAALIDEET